MLVISAYCRNFKPSYRATHFVRKSPYTPAQSRLHNYKKELQKQANTLKTEKKSSPKPSTSGVKIVQDENKVSSDQNLSASMNSLDLMSDDDSSIKTIVGGNALVVPLTVEEKRLDMEVDTGACASMICENTYSNFFSHLDLINTTKTFTSVTGELIGVLGKILVNVNKMNDLNKHELELVIVKNNKEFIPLLGRSWLDILWPQWKSFFVGNYNICKNLVSDFCISVEYLKKHFPNVVSLNSNQPIKQFTANIVLKSNVKPIFHKAYSVPYQLKEEVEKEITKMCEEGILVPVKFSKWASPIVVAPKANSIRICIDCKRTINKHMELEHYPLPRMDDIFADLATCEFYCVIDLSKAYLQLKVSEESQEYLTINTSKGLFRYTRLPFGVASAPAIFQSVMDQVLVNIRGVKCYLDDILIGAETKTKCNEKLLQVLSRLNEFNIKLNLEKCKFFVKEVNFLGHIISKSGIRPKPDKMDAIMKAPAPKNVKELQAYLGLLNYYGRFIPNLSMEIRILYDLLRKGAKFVWSSEVNEVFENSKKLILNNNVLVLYDPNKPIVVSTDASPYGVGAVLSHVIDKVEKPVLFVSSSLSPAEKNYSQLHREALAIVFAIKKFHKYIYAKRFIIHTDNQALKEIFSPSKGTNTVAASRLQRWAVILSMYNYDIIYKPSKNMCHADALSRLPMSSPTKISDNSINRLILNTCPVRYDVLKESQSKDKLISQIKTYVKNGWPKTVSVELKYYHKIRNQFSLEDDCLFYYDRIVVPLDWKDAVLKVLHDCHLGIVRMKMQSRTYVWWSTMNKDIEDYIKSCHTCQKTQNVKKETVITKWKSCSYPFERIHLDFFHLEGKVFLIIADSYSKFIDVKIMNRTTAQSLNNQLDNLFAYFGLPKEIVSDNGPPFTSFEFEDYCKSLGIIVTKTPPYHAQSNGLAERAVQTCKSTLKKLLMENKNINEVLPAFLFNYRNTPCTVTGKTPSEMMLSYKCKTQLSLINPKGNSNKMVMSKTNMNKSKPKNNYSQKSKNKSERVNMENYLSKKIIFVPGEKVLYRNHFRCEIKWIPAIILKQVSSTIYLIKYYNYVRTVHENQIRKSNLADKLHPNVDNIPSHTNNSQFISPCKNEEKWSPGPTYNVFKRKRSKSVSPIQLRRSVRIKKKCIRYGSSSEQ